MNLQVQWKMQDGHDYGNQLEHGQDETSLLHFQYSLFQILIQFLMLRQLCYYSV